MDQEHTAARRGYPSPAPFYLFVIVRLKTAYLVQVKFRDGKLQRICEPYCGSSCYTSYWIDRNRNPSSGLLPRARMREGVKKSVLSVCQSVCPVKNFEIRTFTSLKDCCMRQ